MSSATPMLGAVVAPPLAPTDETLDVAHLERMTLGERGLEHEVLALFERQADLLLRRMVDGGCAAAVMAAHTLKGSARSIGAWRVALAAEAVEVAQATTQTAAVEALAGAVEEARVAIARRMHAH